MGGKKTFFHSFLFRLSHICSGYSKARNSLISETVETEIRRVDDLNEKINRDREISDSIQRYRKILDDEYHQLAIQQEQMQNEILAFIANNAPVTRRNISDMFSNPSGLNSILTQMLDSKLICRTRAEDRWWYWPADTIQHDISYKELLHRNFSDDRIPIITSKIPDNWNFLQMPSEPHPLRGWTNFGRYQISGTSLNTGRATRTLRLAFTQEEALRIASGCIDLKKSYEVKEVLMEKASVEQIAYCKAVGYPVEGFLNTFDASAMLTRYEDGASPNVYVTQNDWESACRSRCVLSALAHRYVFGYYIYPNGKRTPDT